MKSELAPSLTQTVDEVYRNTSVKSVVDLSSPPVSKEENAKVVFSSSYSIKRKNLLKIGWQYGVPKTSPFPTVSLGEGSSSQCSEDKKIKVMN